jgi:hypothetical protein
MPLCSNVTFVQQRWEYRRWRPARRHARLYAVKTGGTMCLKCANKNNGRNGLGGTSIHDNPRAQSV